MMAEDDTTAGTADDGGDVAVGDTPAYGGLPEVIAAFGELNKALDATIVKLTALCTKLDETIRKAQQLDTGAGGTPGSEGTQ